MKPKRSRDSKQGFTLIEILVVMAIFSILIVGVMQVFFSLNQAYTVENVRAGVQQNVRFGITIMVQDLREAGLDPLGTAKAGIEAMSSTRIRFTADRNLDGGIDNSDFERITYTYDAADNQLDQILYEGTTSESNQALIDNVTDVSFTFLDSDGSATLVTSNLRTIEISLTVAEPASRFGTITRTLTARVRCRNL